MDASSSFYHFNVLYIDPNSISAEETKSILEKLFQNVTYLSSSKEALSLLMHESFDIIFSEIHMPEIDGFDLTKEVRSFNANQYVVFISDATENDIFLQALDHGINGFIVKPITLEKSRKAIHNIAAHICEKKELHSYKRELESEVLKGKKELEYSSRHDLLSGCLNQVALFEFLKSNQYCNILFLNIDHFGMINDGYGFEIGDRVLAEVARILRFIAPNELRLYRLHSDEFVFIDVNHRQKGELESIAQEILSFFVDSDVTLEEDGLEFRISFSIGIGSGKGLNVLSHARSALYEIRSYRRGSYNFFDASSQYLSEQQTNLYWVHRIKTLIHEGKIHTLFQPIVENTTKKITKFESLVRLEDEDEIISPYKFMQAAKITGVLPVITRSCIATACKKFRANEYEFSINITSEDIYQEYLEEYLLKHASMNGIDPSRIVLEILEDITTLSETMIIEQLDSLRKRGFKISIDDFGSANSNFSRLIEFNPDYLKIDGVFIKNILEDEKSQVIVEAITLIAKKRGIKLIAEFVSSEAIYKKISEYGIEYSQGYLFGEPSEHLSGCCTL